MRYSALPVVVLAGAVAFGAAACERDARTTEPATEDRAREAPGAADRAGEATREAGREAGEAAREAGRDMREAGREAGEAAREAGRDMRDAGRESGAAAREAGREARDEAREAGRDTGRAVGTAGSAAAGAVETVDVKSALMLDDGIDASSINVDTDGNRKLVVLKGTVRSAAEKTRAEQIAKREAEGYRVDNQLVVRAR